MKKTILIVGIALSMLIVHVIIYGFFFSETNHLNENNINDANVIVLQFSNRLNNSFFANCVKINKIYCDKHGYEYKVEHIRKLKNRHSAWEKIRMIREAFDRQYKTIVWIDDDAFFQSQNRPVEYWLNNNVYYNMNKKINLIIGKSPAGVLQTGAFIIENTLWSRNFINSWINDTTYCRKTHQNRHCCWEQDCLYQFAMKRYKSPDTDHEFQQFGYNDSLITNNHHFYEHTQTIPEDYFACPQHRANVHDCNIRANYTFIIHYASGSKHKTRALQNTIQKLQQLDVT